MKNGLKRIILLTILSLCFLLGFQPVTNTAGADDDTFVLSSTATTEASTLAAPATSGDWTYTYSSGTITAATYNGSATSTKIKIPEKLGGTTITAIDSGNPYGSGVFQNSMVNVNITEVELPSSIKTIGPYSFCNQTLLTSINLDYVTTIGESALTGTAITSLESEAIQSIDLMAFQWCTKLTTIDFPQVTSVGWQAFGYCTALTTVNLDNLTTLNGQTFYNCTSLGSIFLPKLTTVYYGEFEGCYNLNIVNLPKLTTAYSDLFAPWTLKEENLDTFEWEVTEIKFAPLSEVYLPSVTTIVIPLYWDEFEGEYSAGPLFSHNYDSSITVSQYPQPKIINLSSLSTFDSSQVDFSYPTSVYLEELYLNNLTSIPSGILNLFQGLTKVNLSSLTTIPAGSFANSASTLTEVNLSNITAIPDSLFSGATKLASVTSGSDVASVEEAVSTFSVTRATTYSVNLPNCTTIGANAFSGCTSLTSGVYLPKATSIGASAFANTNVTSVTSLITEIPAYMYEDNKSISSVDLTNIITIGAGAFYGCSNLLTVTNADSVETIKDSAFSYCNKLTSISAPSCTSFDDGEAIFACCESLSSVNLPKITAIGMNCFYACTSLTNITLPEATVIGMSAFALCNKLKTDQNSFPKVLTVSTDAFNSCESIESIYLPEATALYGPFSGCSNLKIANLPKVTTLFGPTFNGCTNLTEVYLNSITSISEDAFVYCSNSLQKVNLSSITSVPQNLFHSATALQEVDISSAETIGDYAFNYSGIGELDLPNVITIGNYAFAECNNLSTITHADNVQELGEWAFDSCVSLTSINLPNLITIGYGAFGYCSSLTFISAPNATTIGELAFCECYELTEVYLNSITSVPSDLFEDCLGFLEKVNLSSITSVPDYLFSGAECLTEVYLNSVTSVPSDLFEDCWESIQKVNLSSITTVPAEIFWAAENLTEVDITNATTIEDQAFGYCASLSSINLSNVITIGSWAFQRCDNLTSIVAPNATQIGEGAFSECTSLTSINLPNITTIDVCTFDNCTSLTSINLPNVSTIENMAFMKCSNLTSINLPNITTINMWAFMDCSNLTDTNKTAKGKNYLPATEISDDAFYGTGITTIYLPNIQTLGTDVFGDALEHVLLGIDFDSYDPETAAFATSTTIYGYRYVEHQVMPTADYQVHSQFVDSNAYLYAQQYGNTFVDITLSAELPDTDSVKRGTVDHTISVTANGLDLTYQWYQTTGTKDTNGTLMEGKTKSSLEIDTSTFGTFYYYVVVTNWDSEETITSNICAVYIYDYRISVSAMGSGSLSAGTHYFENSERDLYFESGNSITFTMTPDDGYSIVNIQIDGNDLNRSTLESYIDSKTYTFANISADHSIHVEFDIAYTITINCGANGTITQSLDNTTFANITNEMTMAQGADLYLKITPNTGYKINTITIDETQYNGDDAEGLLTNNVYTFNNISANHIISVTFSEIIYRLYGDCLSGSDNGTVRHYQYANNGIILGTPIAQFPIEVPSLHNTIELRFEPNAGYELSEISLSSGSSPSVQDVIDNHYTWEFTITQDTILQYSFAPKTDIQYSVEVYIQAVNDMPVNKNTGEKNYTSFTVYSGTGTTGTEIDLSQYYITNSDFDAADKQSFYIDNINSSGLTIVHDTYTIDGSDLTIAYIYYNRKSFDLTINYDSDKFESVTGAGTYLYGENVTATATTKVSHNWTGWSGEDIADLSIADTTANPINFTMPAKVITLTANATIKTFNIRIMTGEHYGRGEVYLQGDESKQTYLTFNYGDTPTFELKPNPGYIVTGISITYIGTINLSDNYYTFDPITTSMYINGVFEPIEVNYTVKHYLQTLDSIRSAEKAYELQESDTQTLQGYTESLTTATAKNYPGFHALDFEQKTILGDDSTIIEIYYVRNEYTFTFAIDTGISEISPSVGEHTYYYGESIELDVTLKYGYVFSIWQSDKPALITNIGTANHTLVIPAMENNSKIELTAKSTIQTFTVIVDSGYNGTISPSESLTKEYGSEQTYTITPNTGYLLDFVAIKITATNTIIELLQIGENDEEIKEILQNGIKITFDNNYTLCAEFIPGNSAYTIKHYIEKLDQNADLDETDILGEDNIKYSLYEAPILTEGETDSTTDVTAKDITGFTSQDITNVIITADGNAVVNVFYTRNEYTLTLIKSDGISSVSFESQKFKYGRENIAISATLAEGYNFKGWKEGEGETLSTLVADSGELSTTIISMPDRDVKLTATAEKIYYQISISVNGEGTTTPSTGSHLIAHGGNMNISFSPNNGWYLSKLIILYDNKSTTTYTDINDLSDFEQEGYTLSNITSNGEIQVYFSSTTKTYIVKHYIEKLDQTAELTGNDVDYGNIKYSLHSTTEQTGTMGEMTNAEALTITGFGETSVEIVNTIIGQEDNTTTAYIYYSRNEYELTLNKGTGISEVTPSATTSFKYEQEVSISATVSDGYTWSRWTGDIAYLDDPTKLTNKFTMPADDIEFTATTTINQYTYNILTPSNGTITPADGKYTNTVDYNTEISMTFAPNDGYSLTKITIRNTSDNSTIEILDKSELENIISNGYTLAITYHCEISAEFKAGQVIYKVYHYKQSLSQTDISYDGKYYVLDGEVEELYGTTGENTNATTRTYIGFQTPTISQKIISGDSNNPTEIQIYYNRIEYKLTLKKDDGVSSLSHTTDSVHSVLYENSVTISAEILEGYNWAGWTVTEGSIIGSNIDLTKQKDNTFTMPASNLILTATTSIKTYEINVTKPANGKITTDGHDGSSDYTITVNHGSDSPTFAFTPDSDSFKLVKILLNGVQIDPSETYQITGVTSAYSLSAVFEQNAVKYKVNHYIQNLTSTGVNHSNGLWYTLKDTTEQDGVVGFETDAQAKSYDGFETYEIEKKTIEEPVDSQYTEVNIYYNLQSFTLTINLNNYPSADVSAYINITNSPLVGTFKYTESVSIYAKVLNTTQFSWDKWISSNPTILADITERDSLTFLSTFSMPASDITLTLSLKPNNITIEASVEGEGGSISTDPTDSVEYGNPIVITITPDTNYRIAKLTINGEDKTSGILNNKYTISSATASKYTIIATFELIMYEVTTSVTNGELTGPAYIIAGGTAEYTLKAKTGYSLTKLTINGEDSDISKLEWENNSTTITLTDIGSNQSIYAEFTPDTQTYYVEHYFEKANTSPAEYELTETDTIEGKTGELTKAHNYLIPTDGFYSNFDPAKDNLVIPGDESITIKIYYYRITYTLALISDNPEVSVTGDGQYKFGNNVTINATFNTDKYSWNGWTCTEGNLGNLDAVSYTFEMPAENTTLKANVITNTFSITFETDSNGYIENFENVTQHAGIKYGSSLELKVIPNDESFEISKFTLRNEKTNEETSYLDQLIDNTYILTNITANYTLILEFKTKTYTITTGTITNGSIDPYGVISVEYNKSQEFTLTPHNGYYLSEVTINNEKLSAEEVQKIIDNGGKYTFENVKQNHSISAKFSPINYTITLELSDPNAGTITATTQSGKNVIYYNETININVSLNEGYKVTALVVNGTDIGAVTTYTHTVTSDVEVIAYVEKEKFTITPSCGQHGSIIRGDNGSICDGSPIEVPYNESFLFEFKPDEGYDVADVKINGISQGKIYAYTFTNVTENQTIEVGFEKLILSITTTTNGNGSVTPANTQVEYGQSITLTITPNENYGIKSITINNVIQEEITDTIVIDPVIENMEIVVIFARVYTITTMSGEHGSITESTSVIQGGAITINFTPDPGYRVEKVSVDGNSTAIENNSYTLTNVNRNYTICVSFEAITYTIVLAIESGNGNITCEQSLEDVIHGEQRTFTIAPDYGYQIDKIYVNDKLIDLDGDSFTITIDAPISIRAIFIETPDSFLDKLDMNLILMIIGGALAFIIVIKIFSSIRKKSKAKKQAAKTTYSQEVPYIDAGTYQPGDYRRRPDQNTNSGYRNSYSSNDPNRTNLDEYNKPHQIDPNANQNQTPSAPSTSTPYTDYYGMLQEAKEKYLFRAQQQNNNNDQDNNDSNNSNGS